MNFFVGLSLLVFFVADKSFAKESCITCRGSDCEKEDVLQLECSRFVPALPFESQLLLSGNVGDLEYGCLDLEYYIEDTLDHLKQCIHTSNLASFCDNLEYSLKIKNCSVTSSDGTGSVKSLSNFDASLDELQLYKAESEVKSDGEPEPMLEEGSGSTPDPTTTETPGASAIHLISLSTFLGVILVMFIK